MIRHEFPQMKALVVDDDRLLRRQLCDTLETAGFSTLEAVDGETAIAMIETCLPDLILVDVVMPGMDGFTLCAELRRLPRSRHLPVLMVTSLDDEATINRAYAAGATHYLTKPVSHTQLIHQVRYILRADRHLAELRHKEERLAEAQRIARLGSWEWIPARRELHCSEECRRILAVAADEAVSDPARLLARVCPTDRVKAEAGFSADTPTEQRQVEFRVELPDGSVRQVRGRSRATSDSTDPELRIIGTVQDVSERKAAEEKLLLSRKFFDHSGEMIFIADAAKRIIDCNPGFTRITGFPAEEALGRDLLTFSSRQTAETASSIDFVLSESDHWQGEVLCRRRSGEEFPCLLGISAVRGEEGELTHYVVTGTDLSRLRETENRLNFLTNFDPSTGLPNRHLFLDRLHQALEQPRPGFRPAAVMALDLDHYKEVNETFGQRFGNAVISTIGEKIQGAIPAGATLARLESNRFAMFLEELSGAAQIDRMAQSILDAVAEPMTCEGREIFLTASIGIALAGQDGEAAEVLLKNAETALHVAQQQGRNTFKFFSEKMNARFAQRLEMKTALRRGLDRDEFFLHYQPKFDSQSGRLTGLEALARWHIPERGNVSPGEFIPLAEESGLILPLGERLLRLACAQNRAWQKRGLTPVRVAVNFSARQFYDSDLVGDILRVLDETGLDPRWLEVEITEGAIIQDIDTAVATLKQLRGLGISVALDDFGTGYSSLTYLRSFPLDAIKIDHSFVKKIFSSPGDAAIVKAIIAMAHSLKLKVIAEGVETEEQRVFLREQGCDEIQGYLAQMPVEASVAERYLRPGREDRLEIPISIMRSGHSFTRHKEPAMLQA